MTEVLPFEQVYREHAARVYRFCLSQLGNPSDAEDVAAEVFESALSAYTRVLPDPEGVRPWLLRIARNAVIDHQRRRRRRSLVLARFFADSEPEVDVTVDVEREVILRDEIRALLACLARLSERDRQLVGLRVAAGLSYADIGAVLNVSEHAATVAAGRALTRLRRHYEGVS